jgi:hypothetical protein
VDEETEDGWQATYRHEQQAKEMGAIRRPEWNHPCDCAEPCEGCQARDKTIMTMIDQDLKRAQMEVNTPIILHANENERKAIEEDFVMDERPSTAVADDAKTKDDGVLRSFDTGATRDTSGNKLVFDKFLSAGAIEQYCKYMNMNRLQSDGKLSPDIDTTMKRGRPKKTLTVMSC